MSVDVYDGWAEPAEVEHEYGLSLIDTLTENHYDGIVLAVDHSEFKSMGVEAIRKLGKNKHVLYDVKYVFGTKDSDIRL
jgi:UDP-N-acetyl-D-galactosamine dehydrogenase